MAYPLKPIADRLASKGRYGDDSLVHVSRDELRGLAALHPQGKLPLNPETGQPEAFDLGSILGGIIGGVGGTFIGQPVLGAALGSGLGSYASTGDLGQGIASGLLSFGLGSAVGSLAGEGAGVASDALKGWGGEAASAAVDTGSLLAPEFTQSAYQGATGIGSALNAPAGGFMDGITNGLTEKAGGYLDTLGRAGSNLTNPDALWNTFGKNAMKTTLPIGLGAYGLMGGFGSEGDGGGAPQQQQYGSASTMGTGRQYVPSPQGYRPGFDPEWRYFQGQRPGLGFNEGGEVKDEEEPRITFDEDGNMVMNIRGAEEYSKYYDDLKKEVGEPSYSSPDPFNRQEKEYRFADGGEVSEDEPYIPGTEKDWLYLDTNGPGRGGYKKDNPAYVRKKMREAEDRLKYLDDLTRRNAPWVLNEKLIGKGVPAKNESVASDIARSISEATIGQPYGAVLPPRDTDFEKARREIDELKMQYRQPGYEELLQKYYGSKKYAQGGGISGPGGGLDDAIPAIIDGRHPAQLSSGEYVVPAHAVSALGNGSTEHGIREMDKMVSKVMKKKYGTTNRKPRPLKAEAVMPV